MHQLKIIIGFLFTAFILSACSTNDKAGLYKSNVVNNHPIVIPGNLSDEKIEDYYPVPKLEKQSPAMPVSIVPPGSQLNKK